MVLMKNELGFTLIGSLLRMVIISMTLPLLILLLAKVKVNANIESMSVQQFFFMLQNEINLVDRVSYDKETLYLHEVEYTASIERYGQYLRRRVNNQGHEIYYRGIEKFTVEKHPVGIKVFLTTNTGDMYERILYTNN